ncbi:MAG: hypothetical protein RSF40_01525 [Oscillospiraceae bacterium]
MKTPLTINETVPQVIEGLKELRQWVSDEKINNYQITLILTSLLYSLEHPENHFSDGSTVF